MFLLGRMLPVFSLWKTRNSGQNGNESAERIMGLALEQRSIMIVAFLKPELADRNFSGPCFHVTGNVMHIDAPFRQEFFLCHTEAVEVRFAVAVENLVRYFRFTSILRGYDQDGGFLLDIPTELRSGQLRERVRITPPQTKIRYLELWPLLFDVFPPPPPLVPGYKGHGRGEQEVSLLDISATGLGLRVHKAPVDDPDVCFTAGSRVLAFLRMKNIAPQSAAIRQNTGPLLNLWLTGTVKHCTEREGFSGVSMGVQCTAWAVPDVKEKYLSWKVPRNAGEIPPLQQWVWQQHLALSCRHCDEIIE